MRHFILIDGRRIYNPTEFSNKLKLAAIGLGQYHAHTTRHFTFKVPSFR